MAALKAAAWTVKFSPTKASVEAYRAVIADNVALIEEVPATHRKAVQDVVWRSVMRGGDLSMLSQSLHDNYGVSYDRAAAIARYQCNMARVVMENTRHLELGITEAIWRHSGASKNPRPSHVAFNGKRFKVATGAYLDGKWVWPGSEPDCRCTSRSIIPGLEDQSVVRESRSRA
jgi:SPP1 gp7 family putative phage head morphogenesis protein